MESSLDAYAETYRRATADADALVAGLSPAQFNWKPDASSWSVAECLVHLNTTNAPYVEQMGALLKDGGPRGGPPFRYGMLARLFIASTSPNVRLKSKTLPAMMPATSQYGKPQVMAEFDRINEAFQQLIDQAEGLDVSKIRMRSPFLKVVRLPVGAFLEALAGHELRHIAQARRVTQHPGFPAV